MLANRAADLIRVAGTCAATAGNHVLIAELQQRLAAAGLTDQACWQTNISRADKAEMLAGLSVFSVPALYPEAFGLYVIEAMACGLPCLTSDLPVLKEVKSKEIKDNRRVRA